MLDTFWFIKCKMAWKEKNQKTWLDNKTSLHVRILLSFLDTTVNSSPCYTCFTVLTLWGSSFSSWSMGSSSGENEQPEKSFQAAFLRCWYSTCQMRETSLLTLSAAEGVGAAVSVQRVNTLHELSQNCNGEAQNSIVLTHHLWELPSLCGIWFHSRWPADGGEIGSISWGNVC